MSSAPAVAQQSWVVGISGASGMPYALRLLEVLSALVAKLHVIITPSGQRVLLEECGIQCGLSKLQAGALFPEGSPAASASNIIFHHPNDIAAPIASGSTPFEGMVVIPCSMDTLGALACGLSQNLLQRAADVTLKEGRRLLLVPRETPLTALHLENMLKLARLGVRIVPAMPGFYHRPDSLAQLVDMQVMKVLDQMGIPNALVQRWHERKV